MFSATGMACVMFVMAAMLAVDTHTSGIVAAVMIFAYQAFYTWGFMGGVWVSHKIIDQKQSLTSTDIWTRDLTPRVPFQGYWSRYSHTLALLLCYP